MPLESEAPETQLLVIGYGNSLRSDDAAGRRVAEAIEQFRMAGVRVLSCDLLTPELAEPIAHASKVVFVDASVETKETVQMQELTPTDSSQILAHTADPRTLLALARDVFGHAPQAWWVTIPVENLRIGEELSTGAYAGIQEAIQKVENILRS